MLTAKEEKFSVDVFSGMTLTDAYKDAYNTSNMTDKTANEKASLLAKKDKIRARIEELRKEANSKVILTAIQRKEMLTDIAITNDNVDSKMKAIDILNKMDGEYVQKIQADVDNHVDIQIKIDDEE